MNTMFLMPDGRSEYTVFGQPGEYTDHGITCVLLNRGGRYERGNVIEQLYKCGFSSICSIESAGNSYENERLCRNFPGLRILLLYAKISIGEQINLAMMEAGSKYVMVIWNDQQNLQPVSLLSEYLQEWNELCIVPQLLNDRADPLPIIHTPELHRRDLHIISTHPLYTGTRTLYASDYAGIYNREEFMNCGGYDMHIEEPYWQLVDFGFRAALFSKRIVLDTRWRVTYRMANAVENKSEDKGFARFYLKNLALNFSRNTIAIPLRCLFKLWVRKRIPFFTLLRLRRQAKTWLLQHNGKFFFDAVQLIQQWKTNA